MKILCVMLSFYIFMLSATPCCADDKCMEESKIEQSNHNDHEDDGCNTCPPFFSCGTCSGFVFMYTAYDFKGISAPKKAFTDFYKSPFAEGYFAKIWEPPKQLSL